MEVVLITIVLALAALGGFSVLAALTPNESDNKTLQTILSTINVLGMNIIKAKNKLG